MKKKLIAILLSCAISIFALTGCGGNDVNVDDSKDVSSEESVEDEIEDSEIYTQDFKLINNTGIEIYEIFVSPTGDENWNNDILTTDTLADGQSVDISFNAEEESQYWDIKVTDSQGTAVFWQNIDLFSVSEVELRIDNGQPVANFK